MSSANDFANLTLMHKTTMVLSQMEQSDFVDVTHQQAIEHLQILTDAAKAMSMNARMRYAHLPWKDILALQDTLAKERENHSEEARIHYSFSMNELAVQLQKITAKAA